MPQRVAGSLPGTAALTPLPPSSLLLPATCLTATQVLKFLVFGPVGFAMDWWNLFDFVVTVLTTVSLFIRAMKLVVVLRVFRLAKLLTLARASRMKQVGHSHAIRRHEETRDLGSHTMKSTILGLTALPPSLSLAPPACLYRACSGVHVVVGAGPDHGPAPHHERAQLHALLRLLPRLPPRHLHIHLRSGSYRSPALPACSLPPTHLAPSSSMPQPSIEMLPPGFAAGIAHQVGRSYFWGTLNVPEFGSFAMSVITMFRIISGDG